MRHRGTRRTCRHFSELEACALLRALGDARRACRQAMASALIGGDAYKAAGGVMDAIDAAAEILTGASDAFLPRLPGGSGDGPPNPEPGEVSPAP
jgi:hypothetical protein